MKENDVFVVDRGFRDSLELLRNLGFQIAMPHFLPKGVKQHFVQEGNESRLVTKIRWVVESANGRIKQWRALRHVIPNSQVPFIEDYVRIVCAICNAYRPPLVRCITDAEAMGKSFYYCCMPNMSFRPESKKKHGPDDKKTSSH